MMKKIEASIVGLLALCLLLPAGVRAEQEELTAVSCTVPSGCCYRSGSCRTGTAASCQAPGSIYYGDGRTCSFTCPPPTCRIPVTRITRSGPASFECSAPQAVILDATNNLGLTHQWYMDNAAIAGATGTWYLLPADLNPGSHCFQLESRSSPTCRSRSVAVTVIVNGVPVTIASAGPTQYPACAVGSTRIDVTSAAAGAAFQWFEGNLPIPGETGASFFTPVSLTVGVHRFSVLATSGQCQARSTPITITVRPEPVAITTADPTHYWGCDVRSARLTVSEAPAGASFQWYQGSSPLPGATESFLDTPADLAVGSHPFAVEAIYCGNQRTRSAAIPITVEMAPVAVRTDGPTTWEVCSANSTRLQVDPPLAGAAYQWYQDDVPVAGATETTYDTEVGLGAGIHRVAVEAICGAARTRSAPLVITVEAAPVTITTDDPTSFLDCGGGAARLRVSAAPAGASFQWYQGDLPVAGATADRYDTPSVLAIGSHPFSVEARYCGNAAVRSAPIVITVRSAGVVAIATNDPTYYSACAVRSARLVVYQAPADATFQWLAGDTPIPGATGAVFDTPAGLAAGHHSFAVDATYCTDRRIRSLPIVVSVAAAAGEVTTLRAVRAPEGVHLSWQFPQPIARGYRLYRVTGGDKTLIPLAHYPAPAGVEPIWATWDAAVLGTTDFSPATGPGVQFYQLRTIEPGGTCEGP